MLDSRLIRFQYRVGGVVHLATCHDDNAHGYHVVSGTTLCDKVVHPGQGGWGHSSTSRSAGPKCCTECWRQGAPAERLKF